MQFLYKIYGNFINAGNVKTTLVQPKFGFSSFAGALQIGSVMSSALEGNKYPSKHLLELTIGTALSGL